MDKDTQRKIESCKALQGKTVEDLVTSKRFIDNLAAYLNAQIEDRKQIRKSYEAMRKLGGAKGFKIPAHVIDRFINMSAEEFAAEYIMCVGNCSVRPLSERQYIIQLGRQAYQLTVAQIVCEEYPELEPVLIPKAKAN